MACRRRNQRWPWEYEVRRGPRGNLQLVRYRVAPLHIQNEALRADLILANHYLTQEKEHSSWLQMQLQEAKHALQACEQRANILNGRIARLEHDLDAMGWRYQSVKDHVRELRREKKRLKNEINFLIFREGEDHRRIRSLERELSRKELELTNEKRRADDRQQELSEIQQQLETTKGINTTLRENISDKKAEILRLERDIEVLYWNQ